MPYIDIVSKDDYASLWYRTNTLYSNVGSFDRAKPTIIMLHPQFLDSTWLDKQFNDPRMDSYNIIAFDMRVCGRSRCRPSALHDSWVEAADIAYAHHVSRVMDGFSRRLWPYLSGFASPLMSYFCRRKLVGELCSSFCNTVCYTRPSLNISRIDVWLDSLSFVRAWHSAMFPHRPSMVSQKLPQSYH